MRVDKRILAMVDAELPRDAWRIVEYSDHVKLHVVGQPTIIIGSNHSAPHRRDDSSIFSVRRTIRRYRSANR
jgi:hypothetical protein